MSLDLLTPVRGFQGGVLLLLGSLWWGLLHGRLSPPWAFGGTVAAVAMLVALSRWQRSSRARHIEIAPLPRHLRADVLLRYPELGPVQLDDIERGLRQFFQCHLRARRFVSMPSRAVDTLWHAFILDTRAYQRFCRQAFGSFLYHSPAQTLGQDARRNDGLRRSWFHSCRLEGIDPRAPTALPLLFALDGRLAIADGFRYVPDCRSIDQAAASGVHCGSSFGDGTASGDASGFGGEDGGSSGGDGDGDGGGGD